MAPIVTFRFDHLYFMHHLQELMAYRNAFINVINIMVTTCMILCIVPGSAACVCDLRFSTGRCFDGEGNCECLENYRGSQCNQCNEGYYGFPNCKRKLTGDPCFEENYNYIYSK